ncbi:DExH-box ATP-dependent RNA helicase DExH7, chloroplastic isoform X2 [Lactuca sativa]|uniref:DExH-box ATP-dependent RNA helicase DExH7, chloroplastic isoform X2 n=1 Tax=Lactuca sativa TaxID=4236 RepID=UPI000CB79FAC|nr:DExH-box ATP-dependent RNA helicase DExH7, chloroplastic isoform X2 [Lactuca sativa]
MAPKKKKQQQQRKSASSSSSTSSKSKPQASTGPKLQISAENENRLRRLLLNSGRSTPAPVHEDSSLTKAQKAKKLYSVYEKLSCEGFTDDHIERALSHLKESATFEAALDWLCLILSPNELPLKFRSSSAVLPDEGGFVGIISTARHDWTPLEDSSVATENEMPEISIKSKGQKKVDSLDSFQKSQADWIRQYMEQQEEDEYDSWEDAVVDKISEPRSYDSIREEYHSARLQAIDAKEKGDKNGQQQSGQIIRKLKQELADLGISVDTLAAEFESRYRVIEESSCESKNLDAGVCEKDGDTCSSIEQIDLKDNGAVSESCLEDVSTKGISVNVPSHDGAVVDDDSGDIELGDMFLEDSSSGQVLDARIAELQKKEKMKELTSEKNLEKLEGIWKKGDPLKIPKAILHQLCQRSGWEAPKYNKVQSTGDGSSYTVSVIRKASGRGKSRKVGGLTTLQLPTPGETFETAEDAQNRVAAFALYQLFPDIPVHLMMSDPYATLVLRWLEGDLSGDVKNNEVDRRAGFVDSLLNTNVSDAAVSVDSSVKNDSQISHVQEDKSYRSGGVNTNVESNHKQVESSYLKKQQESKRKMKKYEEMLKVRAALPIAELKGEILHLLKDNDVLVICGETGCGKTTQVPQFILDDMIEGDRGGICNIVCTQPRRIAAISVAERVADERCESSPGSKDSLVGYQVRLDSARHDRTKLLFCTTGILLRMIVGNKSFADITHVIVDEVHERSLLGDFLLIILKNFIEKQSAQSTQKLKVILMSATVDSQLFSHYFGDCPVIHAQGRTHPVTTHFLEDIHESIDYKLASDSLASLRSNAPKQKGAAVDNHRGKKNLVLSGWGDDSVLSEGYINPYYVSENYQTYSEQTQQNLRKLNEDVIDYDLLEDLICHIDKTYPEGAILVFLPGVSEIHTLLDKLAASYQFRGVASEWLLPLHSNIAASEQKKVFQRPPDDIRKVIIATNIAETSITIDDVVYVIDCGKHKENRYNPRKKLSSMVEDWISRANARQRRGRAGRVKPGICFCLYTRYRFEKFMRPFQLPEMLRMPLVELCLQIKLLSLGPIMPFLQKALEPPTEEAITSAISLLYEVGAVEGDEELTPLGYHLAKLPVDVLIGKMMLYGGIFGCLSPILSISAFLSYKSPFVYPKDERHAVERAKLALMTDKVGGTNDPDNGNRQSDHLVMMIAYKKWDKILHENGANAAERFCKSHFLSSSVMYMIRDMRVQFGTLLADIGLIDLPKNYQIGGKWKEKLDSWFSDTSQTFNVYSDHSPLVKALLCAGLYPNVAATEQGISEKSLGTLRQSVGPTTDDSNVWFDGRRVVHVHPSSVNSNSKKFQYPFLVFLEKVETTKVFLRDTTITSPYSILLFGGSMNIQHQTGVVTIDGWLKMAAPAQTAVLFKELRLTLHAILKELIRNPQTGNIAENSVIQSIVHLLLEEDKPKT